MTARRRRRTGLLVWLAALLLLALGRFGPVYPLLDGLPGFDAARYPVKWLAPAVLPLSLLAAMGMRNVLSPDGRARRVFAAATAVAGLALAAVMLALRAPWFERLLAAVAIGPGRGLPSGAGETLVDACLRGLAPAVVVLIVILAAGVGRLRPGIAGAAVVVVIAADLATVNTRLVPTASPELYEREPDAARLIRSDPRGFSRVRVDDITSGVARWAASNPPLDSIAMLQRQTLAGYVAARFGLPTALTRDTEATGPASVFMLAVLAETAPVREQAMIYGSAAVSHLVTDRRLDDPAFEPLGTTRTIAGTSVRVYRNSFERPRAAVVDAVIPYRGDDGYRRVLVEAESDLFSSAALVDLDGGTELPAPLLDLAESTGEGSASRPGRARVVEDRGHRLTIEAATDRPAVLVVADAHLPQWRVLVDGAPAPLFRVNYCFRGVVLDPGSHTVTMTYHPWRWSSTSPNL